MQLILCGFLNWEKTAGVPPGKAAVMQICGGTSCCYVMHIVHSGIPRSLQLLLEDSSILKVCNMYCTDLLYLAQIYEMSFFSFSYSGTYIMLHYSYIIPDTGWSWHCQ